VNIPISTIRDEVPIKKLQSTGNVTNLHGRGHVSIVLMLSEDGSLSARRLSLDHSWRIAKNS